MTITESKKLVKIHPYQGEIYKIFTKNNEILIFYKDNGSISNPLEENKLFELN